AADIERYQEGLPVAARAGDWRYRAGKFLRRHRRAVLGTAAVVLMLLGFAVAMALQAERVTYERDQARLERNKKSQVLSLVLQLFELSSPYVLPGEELTVRQALKRSVPILEDALQDQPEVRAELLHTSGTLLNDLFDHQVAKAQLTEALGILQDQHRDDHPDVVMAMATLASAHRDLLEYEPAEELARAAVASARRLETEGVSQPSEGLLSHALNTLASVLCCRSESPADAELLAREALAVSRDVPGNDGVIEALDRLATMRNNSGDYHEAIELRREVLELLRERFGSDHPRLIATLNNFGLSFRRVESFAESEQAYLEGLRLHRTNFGDKAPSPYLMNNLGALYYAMGDGVRAEKTFREGLAEVQEHFDPWNGFVFSFHLWIERSRILQGKAAEAEAALRQLIPQWKERLNGTLRYWGARGTLGEAVSLQGRCDEAEPHLVESFEALLPGSLMRGKRDALKRLREHFERCDRQERLAAYEAALESSATP
ncbi:MAG: tetratricopeptide repeat protein, partial [Acidobacteriota bacterium]